MQFADATVDGALIALIATVPLDARTFIAAAVRRALHAAASTVEVVGQIVHFAAVISNTIAVSRASVTPACATSSTHTRGTVLNVEAHLKIALGEHRLSVYLEREGDARHRVPSDLERLGARSDELRVGGWDEGSTLVAQQAPSGIQRDGVRTDFELLRDGAARVAHCRKRQSRLTRDRKLADESIDRAARCRRFERQCDRSVGFGLLVNARGVGIATSNQRNARKR